MGARAQCPRDSHENIELALDGGGQEQKLSISVAVGKHTLGNCLVHMMLYDG